MLVALGGRAVALHSVDAFVGSASGCRWPWLLYRDDKRSVNGSRVAQRRTYASLRVLWALAGDGQNSVYNGAAGAGSVAGCGAPVTCLYPRLRAANAAARAQQVSELLKRRSSDGARCWPPAWRYPETRRRLCTATPPLPVAGC